jgi:hypothetical protein
MAFEAMEIYMAFRLVLLNGLFYGYLRGAQRRASQAAFAELGLGAGAGEAPGARASLTDSSPVLGK